VWGGWWDWHVEECDAVRGRHFVALNAAEAPSANFFYAGCGGFGYDVVVRG